MKNNRRQFLKASATGVIAATGTAQAVDPFAPAEPGLPGRLFDAGKQHLLPLWAFDGYLTVEEKIAQQRLLARFNVRISETPARILKFSPTPRFIMQAAQSTLVTKTDAFGDGIAPGKVFHGIATEWGGKLIGCGEYGKAWEEMQKRVLPEGESEYKVGGDLDGVDAKNLKNWEAYKLVRTYRIEMKEVLAPLHPAALDAAGNPLSAVLYGYAGMVPGPTFRFRHGVPCVVRFANHLQTEVSIHHHGGHNPSHSDGFPSFYVLQGEARDYLYPNILPLRQNGEKAELDYGEGQSTTWYHDHGLDATAFNVSHGLAGFALWFDDLELGLIRNGVLPGLGAISAIDPDLPEGVEGKLAAAWKAHDEAEKKKGRVSKLAKDFNASQEPAPGEFYPPIRAPYFNPYDLPIVLQDRIINTATGQIVYDSNGHNGYIGDTQLINGTPWPAFKVKRRKYRLRLLDGSNARIYRLRFLPSDVFNLQPNNDGFLEPAKIRDGILDRDSLDFFRIGKDSWLWTTPIKLNSVVLNMANRADVIVDFADWHAKGKKNARGEVEVYLVNTMPQSDGRGPGEKLAEDAGDPNVFPLPFDLPANNLVVTNMQNAGVLPGGVGGGAVPRLRELDQPIGLIKFIIEDDPGEGDDCLGWKGEDTILRPRHAIKDEEVMAVREFVFERGKGAWMINSRFYDPTISNANPIVGIKKQKFREPDSTKPEADRRQLESLTYAEEWILRNGGGGWWHPIHIHLEGHQLVGYEKDFEAADGAGPALLGGGAQGAMRLLPSWGLLVSKYGFDAMRATADQRTILDKLRNWLLDPTLLANFSFPMREIILNDKIKEVGVPIDYYRRAPALFGLIRNNAEFQSELAKLRPDVRQLANTLLDHLYQLRNTWIGDMVGNHDTQALGPNTIARIRMRFRTWNGPFVFHCHNVEHEDMRMMVNFEPTMDGKCTDPNTHDPNIAPAARTHGQDVTDLVTNPNAVGEMPWEAIDGFPHYRWEEKPIPGTTVDQAGDPPISPRPKQK